MLFHLLEVPRNPVLVPMSTGTTWMMCTCFEINEIFNFFMRKIQSELFRKSTCVTILLFACLGTDKSHSHLSGLKLCLKSDSDSTTISRRKLIYFAAERKSVVIAEQAGASDRSLWSPWSPCCTEKEWQLLSQSK